jgi:CheY-like chemotaxis protein
MGNKEIYEILKDIVAGLRKEDESFQPLPGEFNPNLTLDEAGLDLATLPEVLSEIKARFNGKDLDLESFLVAEVLNTSTVGQLVEKILLGFSPKMAREAIVVYVDDEEENLFVFKRKYGKVLNLKTFTEPISALEFIRQNENVRLVITDEVMPKMSGNELCDAVHETKPLMKFILITGNPNNDGDLMYRALRRNRFYEFINKPLDLEGKGQEYLVTIQGLLDFDW